jgi:hypothetical protein
LYKENLFIICGEKNIPKLADNPKFVGFRKLVVEYISLVKKLNNVIEKEDLFKNSFKVKNVKAEKIKEIEEKIKILTKKKEGLEIYIEKYINII